MNHKNTKKAHKRFQEALIARKNKNRTKVDAVTVKSFTAKTDKDGNTFVNIGSEEYVIKISNLPVFSKQKRGFSNVNTFTPKIQFDGDVFAKAMESAINNLEVDINK